MIIDGYLIDSYDKDVCYGIDYEINGIKVYILIKFCIFFICFSFLYIYICIFDKYRDVLGLLNIIRVRLIFYCFGFE